MKMERFILHSWYAINGSYKLQNVLDGKVLRTPVNGSLLKLYHDQQTWEPMIVIDDRQVN